MRPLFVSLMTIVAFGATAAQAADRGIGAGAGLARDACTPSEHWDFGPDIRPEWRKAYLDFLGGRLSPIRAFAEALALRSLPGGPAERSFAEFWISRALTQGGLVTLAHSGFQALALKDPAEADPGVQVAALDCAARLTQRYPTLELSTGLTAHLALAQKANPLPNQQEIIRRAATLLAVQELSRPEADSAAVKPLIAILAGSGPYLELVLGLEASSAGRHAEAVQHLSAFTTARDFPKSLNKFRDLAHLFRGRAHYALQNYPAAVHAYQQVSKSSNELKEALNEQAWAQVSGDDLGGAIGTAINLQTGLLRRTFSPEAPLVMAMALNELCQFPESIRSINAYRTRYRDSYSWLRANGKGKDYYDLAIRYVKHDNSIHVPEAVASEWIHSPRFIARQDGIHLLFTEREARAVLSAAAVQEQSKMSKDLLNRTVDLKNRYLKARIQLKPGQEIPQRLRDELAALLSDVTHYRRLKRAAPVWKGVLASVEHRDPEIRQRLALGIRADLERMNSHMLSQLESTAETTELIEVEIFNGASQDLIWQNAHPDYAQVAADIQKRAQKAAAEKSLDWGTVSTGLDAEGEVWEDELGSFNANLGDNCSSKEKYLALRRAQLTSQLENGQ